MTTQQRRDQIQIMELEGFAALEQLLLIQDEREQSQQIRDMQAFDEERQQQRRLYPRGRSQQRRHERYQRWLERLEQQQQDPNRQPTN
ncbi:unnamed protein product, partial [Rotaria sp. Silwood1]